MSCQRTTALDEALEEHRLAQNQSKANVLVNMYGKKARACMKSMVHSKQENVCKHARYLGPQLAWDGRAGQE
eukprot:11145570-Karenia_brevis.AAC.1